MKQRTIIKIVALVFSIFFALAVSANAQKKARQVETTATTDTDTRMIDARVVEINKTHISVVARTGVEHVIAVNDKNTKVKMGESLVALTDLHEGDVVNIELDVANPMKFAKNIAVANTDQIARIRR